MRMGIPKRTDPIIEDADQASGVKVLRLNRIITSARSRAVRSADLNHRDWFKLRSKRTTDVTRMKILGTRAFERDHVAFLGFDVQVLFRLCLRVAAIDKASKGTGQQAMTQEKLR